MTMHVISVKCDDCGARIVCSQDGLQATCEYCGAVKFIERNAPVASTENAEYERLLGLAEHMTELYLMGGTVRNETYGTSGINGVIHFFVESELAGGNTCPRYNLAFARAYAKIVVYALTKGESVLGSTREVINCYILPMDAAIQYHPGDTSALEAEKEETIARLQEELRPFPEDDPDGPNATLIPAEKGACYLATAVYGSYDCPQVMTLRRFRDECLARSFVGRSFIAVYYRLSPKLVQIFGQSKWFMRVNRNLLNRFVARLEKMKK